MLCFDKYLDGVHSRIGPPFAGGRFMGNVPFVGITEREWDTLKSHHQINFSFCDILVSFFRNLLFCHGYWSGVRLCGRRAAPATVHGSVGGSIKVGTEIGASDADDD